MCKLYVIIINKKTCITHVYEMHIKGVKSMLANQVARLEEENRILRKLVKKLRKNDGFCEYLEKYFIHYPRTEVFAICYIEYKKIYYNLDFNGESELILFI